jgi:hypothetical protein
MSSCIESRILKVNVKKGDHKYVYLCLLRKIDSLISVHNIAIDFRSSMFNLNHNGDSEITQGKTGQLHTVPGKV